MLKKDTDSRKSRINCEIDLDKLVLNDADIFLINLHLKHLLKDS